MNLTTKLYSGGGGSNQTAQLCPKSLSCGLKIPKNVVVSSTYIVWTNTLTICNITSSTVTHSFRYLPTSFNLLHTGHGLQEPLVWVVLLWWWVVRVAICLTGQCAWTVWGGTSTQNDIIYVQVVASYAAWFSAMGPVAWW